MPPPIKTPIDLVDAFREMRDKTEARLLHLRQQKEGLERSIGCVAAKLEACEEMLNLAKASYRKT